jgi:hypothetical protein
MIPRPVHIQIFALLLTAIWCTASSAAIATPRKFVISAQLTRINEFTSPIICTVRIIANGQTLKHSQPASFDGNAGTCRLVFVADLTPPLNEMFPISLNIQTLMTKRSDINKMMLLNRTQSLTFSASTNRLMTIDFGNINL